jgi:hypothetical protein
MKLKIDNELLAESFFEDTHLLGIVTPIKNYQFVWEINRSLGFTFRLNNSLEIELRKKTRNYFFSIYEYQIPNTSLVNYLYHNQHMGEYLLPEFKHLDFLWLLKGDEVNLADLSSLLQSLRGIPDIQFVDELSYDKIKNKQHLIF